MGEYIFTFERWEISPSLVGKQTCFAVIRGKQHLLLAKSTARETKRKELTELAASRR